MPDAQETLELHDPHALVNRRPGDILTPPPSTADNFLQVIARAAADPNVDVSKFEKLMRLNAEMQFNAAFSRLQPKLPRVTKKGVIEFTSQKTGVTQKTPYARFEDIDTAVRPHLQDEGFSISFGCDPVPDGKGLLVTCVLSHKDGHSRNASMPLPFDNSGSKNTVQASGSSLAYGKRYTMCAVLNIVTEGEDDDAALVGLIGEKQANAILDGIARAKLTPERTSKFLSWLGVKSVNDIPRKDFSRAMQKLEVEIRKANAPAPAMKDFDTFPDPLQFAEGTRIRVLGTEYQQNADKTAWEAVR